MSKNYTLKAQTRDRAGKGIARELRRNNQIPAVIYGDKKEPIKIALDANTMNVEYNKGQMFTTVCEMDVDGKNHKVLARDLQLHPVTDNVIHADFLRVTDKTKIAVDIPVNFINEDKSPGMDAKGVLSITRFTVELMCSAMSIPDQLDVDLTGKQHGDSIKISDASLPEGTTPVITDRDFTIANLMATKKAEEIEAEEAAEADADAAADAPAEGEEGEATAEGEAAAEEKSE